MKTAGKVGSEKGCRRREQRQRKERKKGGWEGKEERGGRMVGNYELPNASLQGCSFQSTRNLTLCHCVPGSQMSLQDLAFALLGVNLTLNPCYFLYSYHLSFRKQLFALCHYLKEQKFLFDFKNTKRKDSGLGYQSNNGTGNTTDIFLEIRLTL